MHWIALSEKVTDNAASEKRLWDAADQFRANTGLKSQGYPAPVLGLTRGFHLDDPLKSSGIPWLGDIPMHWEVRRISRFAKVGHGSTPSRSNLGFWSGGNYPWLNISHVNRGFIDSADQFVPDAPNRRPPDGQAGRARSRRQATRPARRCRRTHRRRARRR